MATTEQADTDAEQLAAALWISSDAGEALGAVSVRDYRQIWHAAWQAALGYARSERQDSEKETGEAMGPVYDGAPGRPSGPSHSQHMRRMFLLLMETDAGRRLLATGVTLNDLYAVYCAGFTEGVWTERVHPGLRKEMGDGDD